MMRSLRMIAAVGVVSILLAAQAWAEPTIAGTTNLVAAENGGSIVAVSSQALDANGQPVPAWSAQNLIDGKHVVGSHTPADSYGWARQSVPSPENPEWIITRLSTLLDELKRYRDSQRFQQAQENLDAVIAPPAAPAGDAPQ